MPSQKVEFPGSQGAPLAGRLDTPETPPRGWAVFAHCFTCSKDSKAAVFVARALAEAGYGVLRFDFTGLGGSGGDFADTHFSSNVDDLVAACDWLRAEHAAPSLLIGHSLGGAAVLAATHRVPEVVAVATLAAPFDPAHVAKQFGEQVKTIEAEGEATVQLAGRPFRVKRALLDDLNSQRQAERIHNLRRPLLVLHAPTDATVSIDNAREIFAAALHPKSFISLDGADHLLTREADARFAASLIATWAARYIDAGQAQPDQASKTTAETATSKAGIDATSTADGAAAKPAMATTASDGKVHVAERGTGAFTVAISAGRHSLLADEPASVGGDDLGPSPYELLSAALGACTAMTLRMYARQKKWPLESVRVVLDHAKIHATDCANCETKVGKIDRIEREITITGDLDAAQRKRLLEIADMCPVHRTLHSEVRIATRTAGADGT